MLKTIGGILTAIITPFTATDSLDIPALKVRMNRQLETGNVIFCDDTNGKFFVLNEQERLNVAQACMDEVTGRAPVVTYIGEISTRETTRLGQRIEKLGVDAVSVIALYFIPPKQEELIVYYSAIADALSILMFLYNTPAHAGNTTRPETARALVSHPNIIGTKDSAGSDENLKGSLNAVRDIDGFDVFNGPNSLIHKGFVEGCSTCVSGLASIAPREINAIWSRFHAGDIKGSYKTQKSITGLCTDLYKVAFSPVTVERALQLMGRDVGDSRYVVSSTPEQINEIQQIVRYYNIN